MADETGFKEIWSGLAKALRAPWEYRTFEVVVSVVGATTVALSVSQPTLSLAWSLTTTINAFLCLFLLVGGLSYLLHFSKKIIARLTKTSHKQLVFFATNMLWVVPHYQIVKTFAPDPLAEFPRVAFRIFVSLLVFQVIWTIITNRLNDELRAKEALVRELVRQRGLIIESEEETRQLVSKYLHNNLQSGLIVVGHQLLEAMKDLPPQTRSKFQSIADELELMRKVEIRDASRALSPNLDVLTFEALVSPLVEIYKQSMKIDVAQSEIDYAKIKPIGLALYRIIEQVLLNAAAHGKASNVQVQLNEIGDEALSLEISNDGAPVSTKEIGHGTGTAVIDTWVASLNGKWSLDLNAAGETVFHATVQLRMVQ